MPQEWVTTGRALCELGIRTLRDEIEEFPDIGRDPEVIAAHTALVLAAEALDGLSRRSEPPALAEAREACARAEVAVARARAAMTLLRERDRSERAGH